MLRKSILGLFVVAAVAGFASTGSANVISKNNPYRSFNVSGINYGSLKWERAHHGNRSSHSHRAGGVFFHGR